jgi:hypothetical protein
MLAAMHATRRVFVAHLTAGVMTARVKGDSGGTAKDAVSSWLRDHFAAFLTPLLAVLKHRCSGHRVRGMGCTCFSECVCVLCVRVCLCLCGECALVPVVC